MERNIMGELNVYRGSGARPNIREIARRHDMDRHTVAKYWRNGRLGAAAGRGQKDNRIGPRDHRTRGEPLHHGWRPSLAKVSFLRPKERSTSTVTLAETRLNSIFS